MIDAIIKTELDAGAQLYISYSGGKDSDAMAEYLTIQFAGTSWKRPILIHADLGRAEWGQTPAYVERRAKELGMELVIVKRSQGDLLQRIQQRHATRPDGVPFPDARNRYCTSELKTAPCDKELRAVLKPGEHAIVAMGIRAEESSARSKKKMVSKRKNLCTKGRIVHNWLPIHKFTVSDVWKQLGYTLAQVKEAQNYAQRLYTMGHSLEYAINCTGWRYHPAYMIGNQRLSCSICILASKNDILNGIQHNPAYYVELVKLEISSGFSFRNNFWLGDLRPDLLPTDVRAAYQSMRNTK